MQIENYVFKNPLYYSKDYKRNNNPTRYFATSMSVSNLSTQKSDTVSFRRTAQNATPLRELMKYNIPGLYSGKTVIPPSVLENLISKKIFSKNIKDIIHYIMPYEESLFDVEQQFFNIIKHFAEKHPKYKLTDVIKEIVPEENQKLLEIQKPIFKKLNHLSEQMPEQQKQQYNNLMLQVNKKLNLEPLIQKFSAKELQYKLKRILDIAKQENDTKNIKVIQNLLTIAQKIPENKSIPTNKKFNNKEKYIHNKIQQGISRKQLTLFNVMETTWLNSNLNNNKELKKLFETTYNKINKIPTIIPFNRKSYIYDLDKILKTLENKDLALKMHQVAKELPTSQQNLSAFVIKCTNYSSDKIGINIFANSIGNIEHLIPHKDNGKDSIPNYAITSAKANVERGSIPLEKYIEEHPLLKSFVQKHIDRLIELSNNGTLQKVGLSKKYILNLVQLLEKFSPQSNKITINIDKLK